MRSGRWPRACAISEIMYHPLDTGNPDDPNTEYIELTNIADQSINLNMVRFTKGIDYTFPSFDLPAGGYCLVVKDLAAFQAKYGSKLPVVGQYTGSLDNAGEACGAGRCGGRDRSRALPTPTIGSRVPTARAFL